MSLRNSRNLTALVLAVGAALGACTAAPTAPATMPAPSPQAAAPAPNYPPSINQLVATAKSLQDLGFTNVTSVDMKFDDWAKAGNPVAMPKK